MNNVISLDAYRARRFPKGDEIVTEMEHIIKTVESEMERDIMMALLIAYKDGEIEVTRSKDGDLQYSLVGEA
jgi:hypothetical protein